MWGTPRLDARQHRLGHAWRRDNIVWGTLNVGDNIVWGTAAAAPTRNIVWGTTCGNDDCDNIVWGTTRAIGDNIVWGTALRTTTSSGARAGIENIVWGTSATRTSDVVLLGRRWVDDPTPTVRQRCQPVRRTSLPADRRSDRHSRSVTHEPGLGGL